MRRGFSERRGLDYPCFLECSESTVLVYRLDSASRDGETDVFLELRDVNSLVLEIELFSDLASRIVLGSTGTV